jgi:hypothetical protein
MTDTIIRGDTAKWSIPIVDDIGDPYPLHGCKVWVTSKTSSDLDDTSALYQHWIEIDGAGDVTAANSMSLGGGGAAAGVVIQELTPAESSQFEVGTFYYDLQVRLADGEVYTSLNNIAETVIADFTREYE